MTDFHLDDTSPVPPYEQVRLRIAELAAAGVYPAGHKLPPVRALAGELNLAANTVARAYRELEQAGLVETRGRAGTVITAKAANTPAAAQQAARRYVETARRLGLTGPQALALVQAALED